MDPRFRGRAAALGGTVAALFVTAYASAHAAPPAAQPVVATAMPHRGCGQPMPAGPTMVTVHVEARDRRVRLYVPRAYRPDRLLPLVLNLHGSGSTGPRQAVASGMDATADAHGFLVAYPEGSRRTGTGYSWNVPGTPSWQPHGPNESVFLGQLIGLLHEDYCADPTRTYAVGFSGGGRMVSQFACSTDRPLAAVAAVGGLRAPSPCATDPVPVLGIHGTADPQNPYDGHGQPYWTYSVPEAARRWAGQDGCAAIPAVTRPSATVALTAYHNCRSGTAVLLYSLAGRGHVWPGIRNTGFDSNETIWRFFAAHQHRILRPDRQDRP